MGAGSAETCPPGPQPSAHRREPPDPHSGWDAGVPTWGLPEGGRLSTVPTHPETRRSRAGPNPGLEGARLRDTPSSGMPIRKPCSGPRDGGALPLPSFGAARLTPKRRTSSPGSPPFLLPGPHCPGSTESALDVRTGPFVTSPSAWVFSRYFRVPAVPGTLSPPREQRQYDVLQTAPQQRPCHACQLRRAPLATGDTCFSGNRSAGGSGRAWPALPQRPLGPARRTQTQPRPQRSCLLSLPVKLQQLKALRNGAGSVTER